MIIYPHHSLPNIYQISTNSLDTSTNYELPNRKADVSVHEAPKPVSTKYLLPGPKRKEINVFLRFWSSW